MTRLSNRCSRSTRYRSGGTHARHATPTATATTRPVAESRDESGRHRAARRTPADRSARCSPGRAVDQDERSTKRIRDEWEQPPGRHRLDTAIPKRIDSHAACDAAPTVSPTPAARGDTCGPRRHRRTTVASGAEARRTRGGGRFGLGPARSPAARRDLHDDTARLGGRAPRADGADPHGAQVSTAEGRPARAGESRLGAGSRPRRAGTRLRASPR